MTPDQPATPAGLHPETAVICAGRPRHTASEPLNVPIVLASNFHADSTEQDGRAYSRTDATPTWEALEAAVGEVEGGHAVAFSSGMAAITAVLDLLPAGGRIVAPKDCYFGVGELLADARQHGRWAVDRVDLTDTASVAAAVVGADLLWLETPSNPLLEVADLPALCAAGRRAGVIVGVDNTFATPLLQQPLTLGADVAVHSATKFIGGHSDLLSGNAPTAKSRGALRPAIGPHDNLICKSRPLLNRASITPLFALRRMSPHIQLTRSAAGRRHPAVLLVRGPRPAT
jgi:cystathionine gamma-synthase